jgi:glycosyltransferase involved in cell wall biosynthesis
MSALRILHVAPYCGDAWAYGGIPRLARTMTVGLARQGHHVTFVTTDACDATTRLTAPEGRSSSRGSGSPRSGWSNTVDGVHLRVFPNLSNRAAYHLQFFTPVGLSGYMQHHASAFDIAHLHACRNLPGVIASHYLTQSGVPYVLAPNGTAPLVERRQAAKRVFDRLFGHRVLNRARRLVAVSEAERRQLASLGVSDDRIHLIPNPVDLDEFATPIARGRFREKVAPGAGPIVLFLGKLTPRKRAGDLVRAFAKLEERPGDSPGARVDNRAATLVIAGNDMGAGASVRALVNSLGLDARTRFTGLLRGAARLEALADADVVVYPSDHEIFGLVAMESLLAGTPVVVADDSGCAEIVREVGGGITVPVGDVDRMADAMRRVLADPAGWRARAVAGAERVRERFGPDRVCGALSDLYADVVHA